MLSILHCSAQAQALAGSTEEVGHVPVRAVLVAVVPGLATPGRGAAMALGVCPDGYPFDCGDGGCCSVDYPFCCEDGLTLRYRLDIGVGYNFSERLGLYALGGGLFGGRLDESIKATYGRLALGVRVKGKRLAFLPGLGLAFSRLVAGAGERFEDHQLALELTSGRW